MENTGTYWNYYSSWSFEDMDVYRPNNENQVTYSAGYGSWRPYLNYQMNNYQGYFNYRSRRENELRKYGNKSENRSYNSCRKKISREKYYSNREIDRRNFPEIYPLYNELKENIINTNELIEETNDFLVVSDSEDSPDYPHNIAMLSYLKAVDKNKCNNKNQSEKTRVNSRSQEKEGNVEVNNNMSIDDSSIHYIKRKRKSVVEENFPEKELKVIIKSDEVPQKRQRRKSIHLSCCEGTDLNKTSHCNVKKQAVDDSLLEVNKDLFEVSDQNKNKRKNNDLNLKNVSINQINEKCDSTRRKSDCEHNQEEKNSEKSDNNDFEVSQILQNIPERKLRSYRSKSIEQNRTIERNELKRSKSVAQMKEMLVFTEFRVTRSKSKEMFNLCPGLPMYSSDKESENIFKDEKSQEELKNGGNDKNKVKLSQQAKKEILSQEDKQEKVNQADKRERLNHRDKKENNDQGNKKENKDQGNKKQKENREDAKQEGTKEIHKIKKIEETPKSYSDCNTTYKNLCLIDFPEKTVVYRELHPQDPRRNYKKMIMVKDIISNNSNNPALIKEREKTPNKRHSFNFEELNPQPKKISSTSRSKSTTVEQWENVKPSKPQTPKRRRKTIDDPDYKPYSRFSIPSSWEESVSEFSKCSRASPAESIISDTNDKEHHETYNNVKIAHTNFEKGMTECSKPFGTKSPTKCHASPCFQNIDRFYRAFTKHHEILEDSVTINIAQDFEDIVKNFFEHLVFYCASIKHLKLFSKISVESKDIGKFQNNLNKLYTAKLDQLKLMFQENCKVIYQKNIDIKKLIEEVYKKFKNSSVQISIDDLHSALKAIFEGFEANDLCKKVNSYLEEVDKIDDNNTYTIEIIENDPDFLRVDKLNDSSCKDVLSDLEMCLQSWSGTSSTQTTSTTSNANIEKPSQGKQHEENQLINQQFHNINPQAQISQSNNQQVLNLSTSGDKLRPNVNIQRLSDEQPVDTNQTIRFNDKNYIIPRQHLTNPPLKRRPNILKANVPSNIAKTNLPIPVLPKTYENKNVNVLKNQILPPTATLQHLSYNPGISGQTNLNNQSNVTLLNQVNNENLMHINNHGVNNQLNNHNLNNQRNNHIPRNQVTNHEMNNSTNNLILRNQVANHELNNSTNNQRIMNPPHNQALINQVHSQALMNEVNNKHFIDQINNPSFMNQFNNHGTINQINNYNVAHQPTVPQYYNQPMNQNVRFSQQIPYYHPSSGQQMAVVNNPGFDQRHGHGVYNNWNYTTKETISPNVIYSTEQMNSSKGTGSTKNYQSTISVRNDLFSPEKVHERGKVPGRMPEMHNIDHGEEKRCDLCHMIAFFGCPCGERVYCSSKCQGIDWAKHSYNCKECLVKKV